MKNDKKDVPRTVRCPQCGTLAPVEGNPYRPFCSQRCKMVDLGAWFKEAYHIAAPVEQDTPDDADPPAESRRKDH